jgi:hypothetical protein
MYAVGSCGDGDIIEKVGNTHAHHPVLDQASHELLLQSCWQNFSTVRKGVCDGRKKKKKKVAQREIHNLFTKAHITKRNKKSVLLY